MGSVGQELKKMRLEKGLSLEDIHKKTKIHLNILKAIEEDSVVNLSPIYIRGFVKIYCKALGVEPKDYIPDYKEPQIPRLVNSNLDSDELTFDGPSFFQKVIAKLKYFKNIDKRVKVGILLALGAILAIFILVKVVSMVAKKIAALPKKEKPVAVSVVEKSQKKKGKTLSAGQVVLAPSLKAKQAEPATKALSGIKLGISARSDCWVTLKSDGKLIFHATLKKGQSENWQAKDKIELSLSDAGAVDVIFNGERIPALGKKGQARKNIIITKEGLSPP